MLAELQQISTTRDRNNYGRDGHIKAASGIFEYKGVKYSINVLRYFILPPIGINVTISCFRPMGLGGRISEYFANLEFPLETKELREVIKMITPESSFLWNDSLNSYCDQMDINQQIEEMHRIAREDIDGLEGYDTIIDAEIRRLEDVRLRLHAMRGVYG